MHYYHQAQLANSGNYLPVEDNILRDATSVCRKYMGYHVIANMHDGSMIEGIIDDMDHEGITMLIPEDIEENADRQFGFNGGFNGGFGGYGRRRFRRFRRRRFPFFVFVFPFFRPYPYYY